MKTVVMIPARLGSQRVPKKNLRFLGGKPLIAWSIEAAKEAAIFDEIYVNSEADIFGEIAQEYGVKFYKRPAHLASNSAINDDFVFDFIKNVPGDILIQLLPTSPFIKADQIQGFLRYMLDNSLDTLVSVQKHQIACLFKNKEINFSRMEPHKPSQNMIPVESYATVLMAWTFKSFRENMEKYGNAYHGANSKVAYYPLGGLTTIDIDNEEDFCLAEIAASYINSADHGEKIYYYESKQNNKEIQEYDVPKIMKKDGVEQSDFDNENLALTNIYKIISSKDSTRSWCHRLVNTDNNSATLISQLPGEGNRLHYHPSWNEWWYIIEGTWEWEIEGVKHLVNKGDLVFIKKNQYHKITAVGDKAAIRLAVSRWDVAHVYPHTE